MTGGVFNRFPSQGTVSQEVNLVQVKNADVDQNANQFIRRLHQLLFILKAVHVTALFYDLKIIILIKCPFFYVQAFSHSFSKGHLKSLAF